jgi:hypothetical protein
VHSELARSLNLFTSFAALQALKLAYARSAWDARLSIVVQKNDRRASSSDALPKAHAIEPLSVSFVGHAGDKTVERRVLARRKPG